jgi:hypothetical protein
MSFRFISGSIDLLKATVIASMMLLLLTHLPASYENYKIRQSILKGFDKAKHANELVVANALHGRSLADGWTDEEVGAEAGISLEPLTGITTVTYPVEIDSGNKTLVLIPMYEKENQLYSLAAEINSKTHLVPANIVTICTSKLTHSENPFINENLGTLQSKYAPATCRFVTKAWTRKL